MATYDMTKGSNLALPVTGLGRHFVTPPAVLDCSVRPLANGDVVQMLQIPAKCRVERLFYEVTTAEGAAVTFTLGDGADADGFIPSINGNALGSGVSSLALAEGGPNTIVGYSGGKYYATADTIDLVAGAAAVKCRIVLRAEIVNFAD